MNRKILIIADSRGRNLGDELSNHLSFDFKVSYHPGATIEEATLYSLKSLYKEKPELIIIMAGICQITYKNKKRRYNLRNSPERVIIRRYFESLDTARQTIMYYCQQRELHMPKISIATQTGANLAAQNKLSIKHQDQDKMDNIIHEINRQVVELNTRYDIPTVWTSKYTHRYSSLTKKYKAGYNSLKDGIHPTEKLTKCWGIEINRACRVIYGLDHESIKNSMKIQIDNDEDMDWDEEIDITLE